MEEEDEDLSLFEFNYPELEIEKAENHELDEVHGSQEEIERFICNQKSANTIRKTVTDMNTLQRYLKSINKDEIKIECLPEQELDHILAKFFMSVRKSTGEEYEPDTISSFQRSIQYPASRVSSLVNAFVFIFCCIGFCFCFLIVRE